MELLQQSVVAFFAAVGISWAIWSAAQALFLSKREKLERCVVLVPVTKDAPALERTVASLVSVRMQHQKFDRILIVDCGLYEEAQEVAKLLTKQNENVALCTMDRVKHDIN